MGEVFGPYPHIVRLDTGEVVELRCPVCKGNTEVDWPNRWLIGIRGIIRHASHAHPGSIVNEKRILADTRILSNEDQVQIRTGHKDAFIERRLVSSKNEDAPALMDKGKKKGTEDIIDEVYPIITTDNDGNYIQLACKFCNGNATVVYISKRAGHRLEFLHGFRGITAHIFNVHTKEVQQKGKGHFTKAWVKENCGTSVTEQFVEELKKDVTGTLIDKVRLETMQSEKDGTPDSGIDTETARPKSETPRRSMKRVEKRNATRRKRGENYRHPSTKPLRPRS